METGLRDGARNVLPVFCFGKDFTGSVEKSAVGITVVLKLKPHPGRGIAKIAVNAQEAWNCCAGASWRPLNVIVSGTNQCPFDFDNTCGNRVVERDDGLQACRGARLCRRRNGEVEGSIDKEN